MSSGKPSVYDVATAAGVSTASVSRYFRSPGKLSAATRTRIGQAVDRLGYLPSGAARGLAERRTGMVGLYSFSQHEPDELERSVHGQPGTVERITESGRPPCLFPLFSDEVLRGVELECTLRRLPLVVGWQDTEDRGVDLDDIAGRGDGVIVLPSTVSDDHLRRLSRHKPVVLVSQPVPDGIAASSVSVDNQGGVREVTTHLADDHGARSFWYAGSTQGAEFEARFRGFEGALRERGLPVPAEPFVGTGSRSLTIEAVRAAFARTPALATSLPDAIVCSSDQTALGVLFVLAELGIQVPTQVAVTGFDGIDAGHVSEPPLTTVRQPMDELGREAVSLLQQHLADDAVPGSVVLPVTLVLRRSCGCP
ncbi:LacI family DNA-binding transcriptional regulator [Galactobacter caseinivorans]|uniref:LacI family DNA-binding transcriptional regulator n=1 Tax=Galactobacter caseinivorans TaxID=2676123 RepID=UPI001314176A|nr:LacI family DNA-binding transcriptional regulator [Galactobacter caseinivorans]